MGADAVASTKQGRCLITAIIVAKGIKSDPWVMGPMWGNSGSHPNGVWTMQQTPGQGSKGWDGKCNGTQEY
eukprot:1105590-Karenia_brevis.AAC.1